MQAAPNLRREREAAQALAVSPRTLQAWRRRGVGPPFVRLGRAVRYDAAALERWIAARQVTPGASPVQTEPRPAPSPHTEPWRAARAAPRDPPHAITPNPDPDEAAVLAELRAANWGEAAIRAALPALVAQRRARRATQGATT